MNAQRLRYVGRWIAHRILVSAGSIGLTLGCFLVLPLMQSLSRPPESDLIVQSIGTAEIPPPPPPPEEEPEPEEETPKEQPIDLTEEAPPLDLSQLELALNPGMGNSSLDGDFAVKLSSVVKDQTSKEVDDLVSLSDLDQKPRVLYQANPTLSAALRKRLPATVHIIFIVDERGRVESPLVKRSTDALFDAPALAAIKQWKFESGKRNGKPVRFPMEVPITFPKGQ